MSGVFSKHTYPSLSVAVDDLTKRGFTEDFSLLSDAIEHKATKKKYEATSFEIVEAYRFDGLTNPDDESVLFAVVASDGTKGTLADAYGVYSDSLSEEMLKKLTFRDK